MWTILVRTIFYDFGGFGGVLNGLPPTFIPGVNVKVPFRRKRYGTNNVLMFFMIFMKNLRNKWNNVLKWLRRAAFVGWDAAWLDFPRDFHHSVGKCSDFHCFLSRELFLLQPRVYKTIKCASSPFFLRQCWCLLHGWIALRISTIRQAGIRTSIVCCLVNCFTPWQMPGEQSNERFHIFWTGSLPGAWLDFPRVFHHSAGRRTEVQLICLVNCSLSGQ